MSLASPAKRMKMRIEVLAHDLAQELVAGDPQIWDEVRAAVREMESALLEYDSAVARRAISDKLRGEKAGRKLLPGEVELGA